MLGMLGKLNECALSRAATLLVSQLDARLFDCRIIIEQVEKTLSIVVQ
jgi:hypothetical protein